MKAKRGTVREDGKIFWARGTSRGVMRERWVSKEKFMELQAQDNKRSQQRYKQDPAAQLEACKRWYEKNKQSKLEKCKKYRKENKDVTRKYYRRRRKNDILYRLSGGIRSLIHSCLKNHGFRKNTKTASILGCSFEEFKIHIESQFLEGMTWENRSEWHLDHIMPVSMAKNYDEVVRLNHYKNFRPMWARDNQRKSDKTPDTLVLF